MVCISGFIYIFAHRIVTLAKSDLPKRPIVKHKISLIIMVVVGMILVAASVTSCSTPNTPVDTKHIGDFH